MTDKPAETPPDVEWLEAHAATIDVVQRGAQIGDDSVTYHLAVVLSSPERVVVLEGSRTRLMDMLEGAVTTLSRMPPQRRDDEDVPVRNEPALPTQAQAHELHDVEVRSISLDPNGMGTITEVDR